QSVGTFDVLYPDHVAVDHDDGLTDVEGAERAQHVTPLGDVSRSVFVRRLPGDTPLRHQQIRRDILDSHHAEAILFENAAYPGQQMIVAAAESLPHTPESAKRPPVEPNFRQRGPHECADENQIPAVLRAKQPFRPAELTDRGPVMAKTLRRQGIASAFQGEYNGIDAAGRQGIGDREWHDATSRDQSNRRRNP